jgi:glutamine amidotransferase
MVKSVAVIDYGSGNLRSAAKALMRAAETVVPATEVMVTADPYLVERADRIVLPGVGAFADCMRGLSAAPGLRDALERAVRRDGKPFLGVCVGMQLMASRGLEHGVHQGLGWIPGEVVRLSPRDATVKVPHMGWNEINLRRPHPIFHALSPGAHAYFVHSYHFRAQEDADIVAAASYGEEIVAAIARDNMVGLQFHPEKSLQFGLDLLGSFLRWRP